MTPTLARYGGASWKFRGPKLKLVGLRQGFSACGCGVQMEGKDGHRHSLCCYIFFRFGFTYHI